MYSGANWTYSPNTRADEERMDIAIEANRCRQAGTHRPVTADGAYGMTCPNCGEFYFRDKAIFA
jgi:hypothetical protein